MAVRTRHKRDRMERQDGDDRTKSWHTQDQERQHPRVSATPGCGLRELRLAEIFLVWAHSSSITQSYMLSETRPANMWR